MNDISRIDWVTSEKGFDLKADNHYIRSMKIIRKERVRLPQRLLE